MGGENPESKEPFCEEDAPSAAVLRLLRVGDVIVFMIIFAFAVMGLFLLFHVQLSDRANMKLGWFNRRLLLLRGYDEGEPFLPGMSRWKWPNFSLALEEGGDDAFFQMLDEGVALDANGGEAMLLLQTAAAGNNVRTLRWLLDRRSTDKQNLEGLLRLATSHKSSDVISELIKRGAKLDTNPSDDEQSPSPAVTTENGGEL